MYYLPYQCGYSNIDISETYSKDMHISTGGFYYGRFPNRPAVVCQDTEDRLVGKQKQTEDGCEDFFSSICLDIYMRYEEIIICV